jgi:protein-S-isoprenylcysteine O-methyltransferase Ste14
VEEKRGETMLGRRSRRFTVETVFMRMVATAGVVGIGVALAAILDSSDVAGWIIGLVVSLLSVVLAAILWSSRQL